MTDGLNSPEQRELRAELDGVRGKLDRLTTDLRIVDEKAENVGRRRKLLEEVCGSLEKLDELGAAALFWGEQVEPQRVAEQIRGARSHLSDFGVQLGDLQKRRLELVKEINREQEGFEILSEDLYYAEEEEELRQNEWVVEREINPLPRREQIMAWARGGEDDWFFRKSLVASLLVSLILGLAFPRIALPVSDLLMNDAALPRRLAQFIRQERVRPTPPPPVVAEEQPAEQEPDPELPEPPEPELAEAPDPPEPQALPQEPPVAAVEPPAGVPGPVDPEIPVGAPPGPPPRAVENTGILAFQDRFASLAADTVAPRLGADARLGDADDVSAASSPSRSMLTTNTPGSSGGIDLSSLSRNVRGGGGGGGGAGGGGGNGGGSGMPGVAVGRATSSIASIGGGDRPRASGGPGLTRTDEEIQIVFDRHKAEFYRFYNRELRNDPTLQGQMVLRLTIEPDGSVSMCALQSSDMNAPDLAAQVVNRVRTINFGAKEGVQTMTIVYPIDFLPASEG